MVSRGFVVGNDDIATVVCAPVYSELLGLRSEVALGIEDGLPNESAIRCDFLTLLFKRKLSADKLKELNRALRYTLELGD